MSSTIDPFNAVPKYYQLASILKQKIEQGEWATRTPIPSERALETQYNVSRPTIRQAIDYLERQGFLYKEHGKGTFVSPQKLQKGMQELTSFSEDLVRRGIRPGQIIRKIEFMVPSVSILQRLELPAGTKVLCVERIKLGDDTPIGLQTSYIALDELRSSPARTWNRPDHSTAFCKINSTSSPPKLMRHLKSQSVLLKKRKNCIFQ